MTLETLHPEALRSVVLDSLYPPDPIPLWSVLTGRARAAFFANCAEDRACASAYAELDGTYRETLDRLTRSPVMVAAPPQLGSASVRIWLTASLFEALVSNLIYYPPNYPTLPRLIAAVHHGDGQEAGTALASVLSILGAGSSALHAAVECRDRPHYREALPADASAMDSSPGSAGRGRTSAYLRWCRPAPRRRRWCWLVNLTPSPDRRSAAMSPRRSARTRVGSKSLGWDTTCGLSARAGPASLPPSSTGRRSPPTRPAPTKRRPSAS